MSLTPKQSQQIDGILDNLNDLLNKRFSQAIRIAPKIANVEADIRWHQIATVRQVLENGKGFGPLKIVVGDILASNDEEKKRALFNPVHQVSILTELITPEEDQHAKGNAGQMSIRDVKSFYKALDPSLDKILMLMQTWIWWDLRDAAEFYRFDQQEQRFQALLSREMDQNILDAYRKEMGLKPGMDINKGMILKFEFDRTREIIEYFENVLANEKGFQVIVVSEERAGSTEADTTTIRLAKRIMAIDKLHAQKEDAEPQVKTFYASQMGVPADQVTRDSIIEYEEMLARRDRQALTEYLVSGCKMGRTANYKLLRIQKLRARFENLAKAGGITLPKPEAAPQA